MRTYTRRSLLRDAIEPIKGVLGLCRLCLEESKESIPIFANKSDICNSLATRIMMCVGYEVTHDECLPNTICADCHKELNRFYEFRKKCASTFHRLKTHLSLVQVKQAHEVSQNKQIEELQKTGLAQQIDKAGKSSRDQLTVALKEGTELEIVKDPSRLQKGLDSIVNGLMEGTDIKGVKDCILDSNQSKDQIEVCPDITEFLSSILVEMGIIKKQDDQVTVKEACSKIQIEAGNSDRLTLEIYEIEEQKSIPNQKANVTPKSKNELPKTNERPRCLVCNKLFATWGVLRRHQRTHTGERPYRCSHCDRTFAQREVQRRHELVHQEVRPFACACCPKSFTQRGALAVHARAHAAPGARPLELHRCTKCPKVFLHASGLSRHAMSHSGRVFVCAQCQRRFSDNSSLRRHQRAKHSPRRPPPPEI